MVEIEELKNILIQKKASLVVAYADGEIKEYYQDRIKDLISILKQNENALKGSKIADKVVGKVAASIMAVAGIEELYADTISKLAIPVLENAKIKYCCNNVVEYIKNNDKTGMCPMEEKYQQETDISKIYYDKIKG